MEQHGSDVFVQLATTGDPGTASRGEVLIQVDSRTEDRDSEHLIFHVAESGAYDLVIEAYATDGDYNPPGGQYRALLRTERPASASDRLRAQAELAFATANIARQRRSTAVDIPGKFRTAERLFGTLDLPKRQGDALYELALLEARAGRTEIASRHFEDSAALFRRAGADRSRAVALARLATLVDRHGEPARAAELLGDSAELFARFGDRYNEANVLHNLGRLEGRRGLVLRSLRLLERSRALRLEHEDRRGLVDSNNGLGEAYLSLGEIELALDHHRRALDLAKQLPTEEDRAEHQATSHYFLGSALVAAQDLDGAAAAFRSAFEASRRHEGAVDPAHFQMAVGLVEVRRGNPRAAYTAYQEALESYRRKGDLPGLAACRNNLAFLFQKVGELDQALELHRSALEIYRRLEDREGEARSLLGIARAHHGRGDLLAALSHAEAALLRIEEVFTSGQAPASRSDLSLPFLTSRQEYYDFVVELLMRLHEQRPGEGYDALALATSEQSRARVLLDLVSARKGDPSRVAPGLRERKLRLQNEINREATGASRGGSKADVAAASEERLRDRLVELYRLTHEIQRQEGGSSLSARTLDLAEIQKLLGHDTALLEYRLGEDRSHLWLVTADGLSTHRLPPEMMLDRLGRRAYGLLVESDQITHSVSAQSALDGLSEILIEPVAPKLDVARLLVVTDGALSYLPFAALRIGSEALIDRFEVVQAPSASVVAALREREAERTAEDWDGLLAMVADPVFTSDDTRLADLSRLPRDLEAERDGFLRLPHSGREARSIVDLASRFGPVISATGFDANRALLLGGRLARYRIVHFATHGVLHSDHPELSALALSHYGPDGSLQAGRLPLHEIYGLELSAQLVVLSACRSALGPESPGEGLLGLPRGFLHAGARRVVVSLWRVDDESTAELMTRFYRHLLEDEEEPAAALRSAQLSLRAESPYAAPYHWAAFVLQGDWL